MVIIKGQNFEIYKIQNLENDEITRDKIEIKNLKIKNINLK